MISLAVASGILICAPISVAAQSVTALLSAEQVEITSNFTGANLTLFGAIELDQPAGAVDLVVLLRGPQVGLTTRRKEQLLGLWISRASETFEAVPAFYELHSTAPLDTVAEGAVLTELGLGLDTIVPGETAFNERRREFSEALIRLQQADGRYDVAVGTIGRPSETVFQTSFSLPADIPIGAYAVEIFVFSSGRPIATAELPLEITKTGAEQFIYDASRNQPWIYGFALIAIAMLSGWLGGVVYQRD